MAGNTVKFEYGYNKRTQCHSALEWSEDFRIAFCTDENIYIQEMPTSPQRREKKMTFHQSLIPSPSEPTNLPGFSPQQYTVWKENFNGASPDDYHEFLLDHTLFPYTKLTGPCTGYCCARWSPKGVDPLGRCVLATLTLDYQLCIYSCLHSQNTWSRLAELSKIYRDRFQEEVDKDMTYQKFKALAFKVSAVALAWSSICMDEKGKYCLLAVAMKSADLVIWKVRCPALSSDDVVMLKQHTSLGSSVVKSVCWSRDVQDGVDLLIAGHTDGTLLAHTVTMATGELVSSHILWEEEDLMAVSCVGCTKLSQKKLLVIATKEHYVMGFIVEQKGIDLQVICQTTDTGPHKLYCTGLCLKKKNQLMCTSDGHILKITTSFHDENMKFSFSPLLSDCVGSRKILGLDTSCNELFFSYLSWPSKVVHDTRPANYYPLHLNVLPLEEYDKLQKTVEKYLLDETIPCRESVDVLEMFRQYIWDGVNPVPSLTQNVTEKDKWWSLPVKFLQVLRYFLTTIILHIPHGDEKELQEERELTQANKASLETLIVIRHIQQCMEIMGQRKGSLSDTENEIAGSMLAWLRTHGEHVSKYTLHVENFVEARNHNCVICDENLVYDKFMAKCCNEHRFGLCLNTFTPCFVNYRVCTTCKSLAREIDYTAEIPWLEKNHCVMCDGLIV